MNILLLTQVFPPAKGGSGRWLWELYRRLKDCTVRVVAGEAPGADDFDRAAALSIARMPLAFSNWGLLSAAGAIHYARAWRSLSRLTRGARPDVVHCGKALPEGLLALGLKRWTGTPYCCFVHGEELTLAATSRELQWLTRAVLRNARRVIANSDHTRRLLQEKWQVLPESIVVMHPGVDTDTFAPAPVDPTVRARLGWSNRRVVLTVGALQKRKGQDMMIRALPAIRERCPDVLYVIVGEGWERDYLNRLVAEHKVEDLVQFRAPGDDPELVTFYQQCDLFALPNRAVGWDFEGFGIVLLEAQACGKPVVAGRSGGTAETLKPAHTGELVATDTSDELARVVVDLLDAPDRRARMGQCAREWVLGRFDWRVLAPQASREFALR